MTLAPSDFGDNLLGSTPWLCLIDFDLLDLTRWLGLVVGLNSLLAWTRCWLGLVVGLDLLLAWTHWLGLIGSDSLLARNRCWLGLVVGSDSLLAQTPCWLRLIGSDLIS